MSVEDNKHATHCFFMKPLLLLLILSNLLLACHKDKHSQAMLLFQEGKELEESNFPDSAINIYRQATELLNGTKENELMGEIYNQCGDLLLSNEVYHRALNAHKKALEYGNMLDNKTQASRAYRGIGKNYYLRKKEQEALSYFTKALQLKDQVWDKEEQSSIYNNLSNIYTVLKEYQTALEYSSKAIQLTQDSAKIYRNYSIKGRLFNLLHEYDSAYYYLLAGSRSQNIRTQASCLFKLAEMPLKSGITDSMKYEYLNKAQILSDSIEYIGKTVQIAEAEHQRQLERLKHEGNNKIMYVVLLSAMAAMLVMLYLYYRYKRRLSLYQDKINRLYTDLNGQNEEKISDNDHREKQIIHIVSRTGNTCTANFTSSPFYAELKKKLRSDDCSLTYAELDELQKVIFKEFDIYIQQISAIINLSANDITLCCLSLLRFTTKECAICRGVSNETIRSQRTRIKKKIPKTFFNNGLFNVIFGEE